MINYKLLTFDMAGEYLEFLKRLDSESEYMHYRTNERNMTEQGMKSRIKKQDNQGNSFSVIALDEGVIVGYFSVNGGNSLSSCHSANVAIGVLEMYRGKGIANNLFSNAENIARERGVLRFECTVVQENVSAVKFYMRKGFTICGYYNASFKTIDNRFVDEWILEYLLKI